jgi:hypothetical protein
VHRGAEGGGLEGLPDDVELAQLVTGQPGDAVATTRLVVDQAFPDKGFQRLAHRDEAAVEEPRHLVQRDGRTRGGVTDEDDAAQLPEDLLLAARLARSARRQAVDEVCGHRWSAHAYLLPTFSPA